MENKSEGESTQLLPKKSTTFILILTAVILILTAFSSSIGSSIRYGFLVIYCSKRGIPGSIYGFIESSKVVGYVFAFFTKRFLDRLLSRFSPKWVIEWSLFMIIVTMIVSGLADYTDNNTIFLFLSILMRALQGYVGFMFHVAVLDLAHALYSKDFDRMIGLLQLGYFSGHGIGQWMGVALYEHYGYFVPFAAASAILVLLMMLSLMILPSCPSFVKRKVTDSDESTISSFEEGDKSGLSWLILLPFFSTILVNLIYSVVQLFVTPYLYNEFHISLTVGGSVLTCASAGMGLGSVLSGMLVHSKIFTTSTQMTVGAFMVAMGVLLVFPNPAITPLHSHPLLSSYPAVLLASLGDPILTIPALKTMKEIQLSNKNIITPKQTIRITEIWLVGTCSANYMGSLIAGVLIQFLKMFESAYILAIMCVISMCCSVGLKMFIRPKNSNYFDEYVITEYDEFDNCDDATLRYNL